MKIFFSGHRIPGMASGVEKLPTRQSKGLQEMRLFYLAYGLGNLSLSVWCMFKETPSKWSGVLFALKLQYFLEKKINVKESSLLKLAKLFFSKGLFPTCKPLMQLYKGWQTSFHNYFAIPNTSLIAFLSFFKEKHFAGQILYFSLYIRP